MMIVAGITLPSMANWVAAGTASIRAVVAAARLTSAMATVDARGTARTWRLLFLGTPL
jgi:hypothetical protein